MADEAAINPDGNQAGHSLLQVHTEVQEKTERERREGKAEKAIAMLGGM